MGFLHDEQSPADPAAGGADGVCGVLGADDPPYAAPEDVTTYMLGYLKPGATGTPVG